jgi:chromosome segregation ATPase
MDWLETKIKEQISARVSRTPPGQVAGFLRIASNQFPDNAAIALDLVSEAAEAIKSAEQRAAETMARAQSLASDAAEKLRLAQARIERAEIAQRAAEAELADFRDELERVRNDLKQAEAQLEINAEELAAAEERASVAERRANDAEAALESIVRAIRTQLLRKDEIAATKPGATA